MRAEKAQGMHMQSAGGYVCGIVCIKADRARTTARAPGQVDTAAGLGPVPVRAWWQAGPCLARRCRLQGGRAVLEPRLQLGLGSAQSARAPHASGASTRQSAPHGKARARCGTRKAAQPVPRKTRQGSAGV